MSPVMVRSARTGRAQWGEMSPVMVRSAKTGRAQWGEMSPVKVRSAGSGSVTYYRPARHLTDSHRF